MQKLTRTPQTHRGFWTLLILLLSLITLRYALQINIPRAVFLSIIVLACLFGQQDEIAAMCICCIPLHESIDFFYAQVICVLFYIFKCSRHIRINISVILVFAMIIWELLHCLGGSFSVMEFITNIVPLAVLAIMMCSDLSRVNYGFLVRAMAAATLGVCISLFVKVLFLADFNILLAVSGLQRLGVNTSQSEVQSVISGGDVNPNTLGIIGVLAATGLMQLRSAKLGRSFDMVLACIIMVFCALTASRTYLVCLALMFVLLVFGQKGSVSQKMRFLGLAVLLILLALAALYICFPDLLKYYISRFFVKDITTGRTGLMVAYHDYIVSNPDVLLFGTGLQDFGVRLTQKLMIARHVPHNAIQELVIAWGLPGVILFGILLLTMAALSRHHCRRQGLLNYIPLIIILVKSQAGQMLNSAYTMLAFSYAYLSMCTDLTPKRELRVFTRNRNNTDPGTI